MVTLRLTERAAHPWTSRIRSTDANATIGAVEVPHLLQAAGITGREMEVLECLGARLTNAEIAERLYISIRTVESHVSALLRKLGEQDRRALARRAQNLLDAPLVALPGSLAEVQAAVPFVGRTHEMTELVSLAITARASGVRRFALIAGEAGIGKTRLAAEAAARLHAAGFEVIHGRCVEDALVPYQAIVEAVRSLVDATNDPFTAHSDEREPGRSDRYRLFEDVDRLLASRRAPVVFVLDDFQWLDPSGLQLLRHVINHTDRSALLIITTARPEAIDPRHPLAATLGQAANALTVLGLGGLSREEAESLAAELGTRDRSRTHAAWDRTGGNPFLLAELLRHAHATETLPTTARDAIVRRIAGLGPPVFEALTAAAVAGEAFRLDEVIAVVGDASTCRDAIERAYGAGLLTEDSSHGGTYRFTHAIVRESLLAVASPGQRARSHLKLAATLASRPEPPLPEIAYHCHAALPDGDIAAARDAALAAYDNSMRQLAYEGAASLASMALDAIAAGAGDAADRATATLRRGQAHLSAGDLPRAIDDFRQALDIATAQGNTQLAARAVLGWADASAVWARHPELRRALDRLLAGGVHDDSLQPRLKAKLAQLLYYEGEPDRRRQLAQEAITDAHRSGRADVLASVLVSTHAANWEPAHLEQRLDAARQIVSIAVASGQPALELDGLGWLAVDLLEAGDLAATEDILARHAALAAQLHHRLGLRDAELWAGMRAMLDGRFPDAEVHVERARDLGDTARDPATDSMYWVQRYWLVVERGDPSEMDDLAGACERIVADNPDVPAWRAALAMVHARRADHESALVEFERLAVDRFLHIPRDVVWLNAMTYLAETCAFLGDTDRAPLLFTALEPYASRVALIDRALVCKGSVERFLGLLAATAGNRDAAKDHLTRALVIHDAMGARPLVERTRDDLNNQQ
jgi:DNA-binding CsgD family transcriptional regulator/tetratricopeptide (TPR) repeat protein